MISKAIQKENQQSPEYQHLWLRLNKLLHEELFILGRYNGFFFRHQAEKCSASIRLIQNIHNHRVADITQYVRELGGRAMREIHPERYRQYAKPNDRSDVQYHLDQLYRMENELAVRYANLSIGAYSEPLYSFLKANAVQQNWITNQRSAFEAKQPLPH